MMKQNVKMRDKLGCFIVGHPNIGSVPPRIYKNKTAICKNCKKEFIYRPNKYHPNRVYCSKKCMYEMGGRKGVSLSEESRGLMSKKMSGKNHYAWRGGLSRNRFSLYHSKKYREWRTKIFIRDNRTCQICGARNGEGKKIKMEADHIIPWAEYKEGWFNVSNGRTLCKECHKKVTREYMKKNWKNQFASATSETC